MWELLERCWVAQPRNRPSIRDVLQFLEKVSSSWTPPSLPTTVPPTSGTFEITNMDEEEGIITSLFQPSNDMNIEGEVPSSSQPPDGHGLPPEGDADRKSVV